jgi:tetratricopeptide (TPR) repeat protein
MLARNIFFTVIVVGLFFGALELALALFGVRPMALTEDPLVGFADNVPLFVEASRPDGSAIVRTAGRQMRLFNHQEFVRDKGDNSYRIFCMGGSTTYGRPYSDRVSFCGWLRAYLRAADPGRDWQVINAGGISFASYRVARLMNELNRYRPDLYVVYSGHNEFLEERSYGALIDLPPWVLRLNAALSATRTYTAMARLFARVRPDAGPGAQDGSVLSADVDEILNHSLGPDSYHRDDDLKRQIITHYELNMTRMVKLARSAGADLVFVKPVLNLKDMSPFKSEHSPALGESEKQAFDSLYNRARELQAAGEAGAALDLYGRALAIDPRYADVHYRLGQALFELGRYGPAEQAFRRAVEEDIVPLRALASMQRIVERVAESEGVPLVDFPALLRAVYLEQYGHPVFGEEYFSDHVHTRIEGYRLLGEALFDLLVEQGVAQPDASWNEARMQAVAEQLLAGLDPTLEGRSLLTLGRVLDWAGKHDEAYALFRRALESLGPSPMLYDRLARSAFIRGDIDASIDYLRETLVLYAGMPGVNLRLAQLLQNQGQIAAAIEHCRAELEINPSDAYVHGGLANLLEMHGDGQAALRHYELALDIEPDNEYALVKRSFLLIEQERYQEALQDSHKLLSINPQQYRAHTALGLIRERQGDVEAAARHFGEALRLHPGEPTASEHLRKLRSDTDDIAASLAVGVP